MRRKEFTSRIYKGQAASLPDSEEGVEFSAVPRSAGVSTCRLRSKTDVRPAPSRHKELKQDMALATGGAKQHGGAFYMLTVCDSLEMERKGWRRVEMFQVFF